MGNLTKDEIYKFLMLFNRNGYVLDFSSNDIFNAFTTASVGVALCNKYSTSKGKSLEAYTNDATDEDVEKLLSDLLSHYEENYKQEFTKEIPDEDISECSKHKYNETYAQLYKKCREYMNRVQNITTPLARNAAELQEKFSSEYLSQQIELMLKMQSENPTDAIGKAKELIESCCKTILDSREIVCNINWDVGQLTGETLKTLKLMPKDIPEDAPAATEMKALLGNLRAIATNVAALRNHYGSGHGKSADYKGLSQRHAKLAVGSSITLVEFLWETHLDRPKEK